MEDNVPDRLFAAINASGFLFLLGGTRLLCCALGACGIVCAVGAFGTGATAGAVGALGTGDMVGAVDVRRTGGAGVLGCV